MSCAVPVERRGRGVEKVVRECRNHGCPKPEYSINPGEPGDIMVRVDVAPDAIVDSGENNRETINETIRETINGPISGPINDPIKSGFSNNIQQHSGCKQAEIVKEIDVPSRTLKRILAELSGKIECRGSKKTGGYFLKG